MNHVQSNVKSVTAQGSVVSDTRLQITDDDVFRYLLQEILSMGGICHEYMLLEALVAIEKHRNKDVDISELGARHWLTLLNDYINKISVKLSFLNYKLLPVNHSLGRAFVSRNLRLHALLGLELPPSSKFYVYANELSTDDTKLATGLTTREIEFLRWSIEKFCISGSKLVKFQPSMRCFLSQTVDDIISAHCSNQHQFWNLYSTYALGSHELHEYDQITSMEIENLLAKLCDLKWLYKSKDGRYGMDVRTLAELEDFLLETYENLSKCVICSHVVLQGVICANTNCTSVVNNKQRRAWHLDCFQHYVTHLQQACDYCNESLSTSGAYIL